MRTSCQTCANISVATNSSDGQPGCPANAFHRQAVHEMRQAFAAGVHWKYKNCHALHHSTAYRSKKSATPTSSKSTIRNCQPGIADSFAAMHRRLPHTKRIRRLQGRISLVHQFSTVLCCAFSLRTPFAAFFLGHRPQPMPAWQAIRRSLSAFPYIIGMPKRRQYHMSPLLGMYT